MRPPSPHAGHRSLVSRRDVLQAGAISLLGLQLPQLLAAQARGAVGGAAAATGFGRAKRCILLFMWGGPSQLDTFDPKPDAPADVRGEFQSIASNVPGVAVSEHFRHMATRMDKVALLRSLHHSDPAHLSSGHTTLTGRLAPNVRSDRDPPSRRDTPHIGSVISKLRPAAGGLPSFVMLPWIAYHPAAPGGHAPGQHGGFLGARHDPLLVEGDPNHAEWTPPALRLADGVSPERLTDRRALLARFNADRRALERLAASADLGAQQSQAFDFLASEQVRQAFDLAAEPADLRDRYGRNTHGQCVLLARRLVERGVPLVSVNWHNDGKNFWDTHGNNFTRLKNDLIPPADQALAALLDDLSERGLLDDTIVAWVGEFGRTPQAKNGGREHWPFCYCGLLAGGGVRGGVVHGASDRQAAYPAFDPVTPHDYAATLYHALGVPDDTVLYDSANRPHQLYTGRPLEALFA